LFAGREEDDVELVLLLGRCTTVAGRSRGRNSDGRGRFDAELFLHLLGKLGRFEHGQRLDRLENLVNLGHRYSPSWVSVPDCASASGSGVAAGASSGVASAVVSSASGASASGASASGASA